MLYFTSDLHFGHTGVLKFNNRPFEDIREMAEVFIANYNSVVKNSDTVYLLGDLAYKIAPKYANAYFKRLKGKKHLIIGNHDEYKRYDSSLFEEIEVYKYIHAYDVRIALMHYPILDWQGGRNKGGLMLHGHLHSKPEDNLKNKMNNIRRYDVGVDANYYYPVSILQIKDFFGIS